MTFLLLLNVALFLCVAAGGALAAWLGWEISGDDEQRSDLGDGGSPARPWVPIGDLPGGGPPMRAGPSDLSRSA